MKLWALVLISFFLSACATGGKFKLQQYETVQLENGLEILFLPDSKLPSFSLMTLFKSGSSSDPTAKSGLSSFVGGMLSKGTKTKSATEFAEAIEFIGAGFDVNVGQDFTMVDAGGLSFHWETILDNYADAIINPAFKKNEIRRYKKQILSSLKRTVDDSRGFTDVAFKSYLFGSHPYARRTLGRYRDVQRFKRKDIIKHYFKYYRPNNAIIAVIGDYNKEQVLAKLKKAFGGWKPRVIKSPIFPQFPQISGTQIQLISKPDLKQSQIRLGHKGIKRSNPDYIPLRVANTILGGNFSSRLNSEIRISRGLTYGISSFFSARLDNGPFAIYTSCANEKVGEAIRETLNMLKVTRKEGITQEELDNAKGYMKGIFPKVLETTERVAQNLLILRFYGISDDYLKTFLNEVEKVSVSDVNRMVKKYLSPEDIKILVYSKKSDVLGQLRPIGPVKVKSYREFL